MDTVAFLVFVCGGGGEWRWLVRVFWRSVVAYIFGSWCSRMLWDFL